ncbi:MAG: hypothetical protein EXQ94_08035 [Alphaproteobacteria bacterium]|nr:hypothetical protein [Alphaproteobacteria bacterium]
MRPWMGTATGLALTAMTMYVHPAGASPVGNAYTLVFDGLGGSDTVCASAITYCEGHANPGPFTFDGTAEGLNNDQNIGTAAAGGNDLWVIESRQVLDPTSERLTFTLFGDENDDSATGSPPAPADFGRLFNAAFSVITIVQMKIADLIWTEFADGVTVEGITLTLTWDGRNDTVVNMGALPIDPVQVAALDLDVLTSGLGTVADPLGLLVAFDGDDLYRSRDIQIGEDVLSVIFPATDVHLSFVVREFVPVEEEPLPGPGPAPIPASGLFAFALLVLAKLRRAA